MKVSYLWLNEYLNGQLPKVDKAAEILTMNSNEVDAVEPVGDDYVLDVKILPNMAHSCLCHRGIAREFGALLNLKTKKYCRDFIDYEPSQVSQALKIKIENPADCRRYIGRVIQGIKIGPSPAWLKTKLETLGQRSINNLVDATNFVMLEIGQPMHVFDADKLVGDTIEIKKAKVGDLMKTLDGKDIVLDNSVLVISNNNQALAVAGIKGGTLAEIDGETKNIVLESANFDPVLIRRTAQKIKIQTDASKRYENDYAPELAWEAMDILTKLIVEIAGTKETQVGAVVDVYPHPTPSFSLGISAKEVEKVLGLQIPEVEMEKVFKRFDFVYKKDGEQYVVDIPVDRLDLRIKADLIEEVGRVYGYDKLADSKMEISQTKGQVNKSFYYANKIRRILAEQGFSEIYGYSFAEKGEIELANSVAPDKKWLRSDLVLGLKGYLDFNSHYSELIDMPQVKIFEIGKVFRTSGEFYHLAFGVKDVIGQKKVKDGLTVVKEICDLLNSSFETTYFTSKKLNQEGNMAEFDFDQFVKTLPEPKSYDVSLPSASDSLRFKKISIYPFVVRDVAVFVPEGVKQEEVFGLIKKEAGDLLVKDRLFDVFTKKLPDGSAKTSYAFRLVLQSYDHTLSEEEITGLMSKITLKLNAQKDWQVR